MWRWKDDTGENRPWMDSGTAIDCVSVDGGDGGTISVVRVEIWEDMLCTEMRDAMFWRGKMEVSEGVIDELEAS